MRYACNSLPDTIRLTDTITKDYVVFYNKHAWVQEGKKPYISKVIKNPTYAHALECLDESIKCTGDAHHVFLEGIRFLSNKPNEYGVWEINLVTGS